VDGGAWNTILDGAPIEWTAPPLPPFFLATMGDFDRPICCGWDPPLGVAWYGPMNFGQDPSATRERVRAMQRAAAEDASEQLPFVFGRLQALNLRARIAATARITDRRRANMGASRFCARMGRLHGHILREARYRRDPYSHDIRPIATALEGGRVPIEDDRAREWKDIA
jgi:hypothetical protein